jgi:hypothetical protein
VQVLFRRAEALLEIHPAFVEDSTFVQIKSGFFAHFLQGVGQIGSKALSISRSRGQPVTQIGVVHSFRGFRVSFRGVVARGDQIVEGF